MAGKRGFGEVEERKNAKTKKRTGFRARYTGPDVARHSMTFTTKKDAEAWLIAEEALIARGLWTAPRSRTTARALTVQEYADANLSDRTLSPRTREEYDSYIRRFVSCQPLGRMALKSVTSTEVRVWLGNVRSATGPTMAARVYGFVGSVFNAAYRDGLIDRTPFTVRGASNAPRQREKVIATPSEVVALVEHVPERFRALVLVTAWGGLRSGEARALARRDVDLKAGTVTVRRQVQQVRGEGQVLREPKTSAAIRTLHLPEVAVAALADHLTKFSQPGRDGLVFPSSVGTPISQTALTETWDRARCAIGRPELRFHDLRATAATRAAQFGATGAELMARFGWSTAAVAMRYVTAMQDRDAGIARSMDALAAGGEAEYQSGARALTR
ncbi:hypothetical protein GCM10025865_27240 [Paraoerskovia sediminicola]|uniref:Site-specific recombinase XerD n=1 Tax=Paraoerskovia sediminicola TaxID=1138587 RepID=A0ABN6XIK1_9CELL|nr:site-specific integrase [Paraoerskovia sediminicola]BDZ43425.1 hypothetical protein GCM10025865_27240 [Paraoerskovia sediminicola]